MPAFRLATMPSSPWGDDRVEENLAVVEHVGEPGATAFAPDAKQCPPLAPRVACHVVTVDAEQVEG